MEYVIMNKLKSKDKCSVGLQVDFTSEIIQSLKKQLQMVSKSAKLIVEPSEQLGELDNLVISSKKHFNPHLDSSNKFSIQSQSSLSLVPDKKWQQTFDVKKPEIAPNDSVSKAKLSKRHLIKQQSSCMRTKTPSVPRLKLKKKGEIKSPYEKLMNKSRSPTRNSRILLPGPIRSQSTKNIQKPIDWSLSLLDSSEFESIEILPIQVVEHYKKQGTIPLANAKTLFYQAIRSIEVLQKELGLWNEPLIEPVFTSQSLKGVLNRCSSLLYWKTLTLDVLRLIHDREEVIIDTFANPGPNKQISYLYSIERELETAVETWKDSGIPYSTFIYMGENILDKIKADRRKLLLDSY